MDIVYLDFAKAFDKVSHFRLMIKLQSLGITESIFKWIKMYLSGYYSEWNICSGVPQGSVWGQYFL